MMPPVEMSKPEVPQRTVVVPQAPKGGQKLVSLLIYALARLLMLTWRIKWEDRSGLFTGQSGPLIFCIWHNRLALSMLIYHRYVRKKRPTQGLGAMISASKDGGLLADVLQRFEVRPIRGSTSRRGRQALLEATTAAEEGYHIAITPDGPRGPRYKIQDGILALAQVTGLPIVPVSVKIEGKIRMRSWDQFQIPLPFAKCTIHMAAPVQVPREATDTEREQIRRKLEGTMLEVTVD